MTASPHGRGHTAADRTGRPELEAGASFVSTTWTPNEHQRRVMAVDRGFVFSVGGLGSGKSEAAAVKLLMWALRHPRRADGRPTQWYAVAPEFGLIRTEMFPKILEHARRLRELGYGAVVKRVVQGMDPKIVLMHDQVILGRSADAPDRMRGFEVDGAWGDEAQRWAWKVFRMLVTRMRSAKAVRLALSASPEDAPGWLWKALEGKHKKFNLIRKALLDDGAGLWCFRWRSDANKANEAGTLGVIGAVLDANPDVPEESQQGTGPSVLQAQELGGRFPGTDEAPSLSVTDYARAFAAKDLQLSAEEARPEVLASDVGETVDFTWPVVMSGRGVALYMARWNAGSPDVPRSTFYVFLEEVLAELAIKWGVRKLVLDSSKAGKPVVQNLERRRQERRLGRVESVLGYDCSVPRKKAEAIEAVGVAMAGGSVRVPERWTGPDGDHVVEEVGWLRKEFSELVVFEHGSGKRSFDHPAGGHDDGVTSLALAWNVVSGRVETPGDYSTWNQPKIGSGRFGSGGPPRFGGLGAGRFGPR